MRLVQPRLVRRVALAAMVATALGLVWGVGIGQAASANEYYVDAGENVCVGNQFASPFCDWEGKLVGAGENTALGNNALKALTSGGGNTASGARALSKNTSGGFNTALGWGALEELTKGFDNTATGAAALASNTTGGHNTASGVNALESNTIGEDNTANGYDALFANTTGNGNVASGREALFANTTGIHNVASGFEALFSNHGNANVATGFTALLNNKTGFNNVATGTEALESNTIGEDNTAIGGDALALNTSGGNNTAIGFLALFNNTEGSSNVALGKDAGFNLTGSNNIDIANFGGAGESGTTRIGTEGEQTKAFVAGIHNTPVSGCTVQVTSVGQLGCNSAAGSNTTGGAVARFASKDNAGNEQCLGTQGSFGHNKCPTSVMMGDFERWAEGPVPAAGGSISNLYAETETTMPAGKHAVVEVLDMTPPSGPQNMVLSCEVEAGQTHCENTKSETITKGHYMLVRIKTTAPNATWRVSFRY